MMPWLNFDILYNYTLIGAKYRRCLKTLHDFVNQVIDRKREDLKSSASHESEIYDEREKIRRPFLDLMLAASDNGKSLSSSDINEEVNTFMFEGHDTTSMAMSWFLYCMATNQKQQDRVRDELFQVFGESDRWCTRNDLGQLKYLECCIKESLRLYPSVALFTRMTTEDVKIGKYTIPPGVNLDVSIYAIHRNPRIYPDPLVFNPDRFLPEHSADRHPFAFIPFSAGPRNCIGQRFAMTEEKVLLSTLLRKFRFDLSPTAPKPVPTIQLTLKSLTGIHLLVSDH